MFDDICSEDVFCSTVMFSQQGMIEASVALLGLKSCDEISSSFFKGKRAGSNEGENGAGDLSLLDLDSDTFYDAIGLARSSTVASGVIDFINQMGQAYALHARFLPAGGFRCCCDESADTHILFFSFAHSAAPCASLKSFSTALTRSGTDPAQCPSVQRSRRLHPARPG